MNVMDTPSTASEVFTIERVSRGPIRRLMAVLASTVAVLFAMVTDNYNEGTAFRPGLWRYVVRERGTGRTLATIDQKTGEDFDTGAILACDLDALTPDAFAATWGLDWRADQPR